jgi:hypothetical protein
MPIVTCSSCEKEILRKHSDINRSDFHFCNRKCYGEWISKTQVGRNNPNHKDKITRDCEYCNKKFKVHPYRTNYTNVRFCSYKCYDLWRGQESKKSVTTCVVCGKEKQSNPSRIRKGMDKTCSKTCEAILKSQTRLKENNPNWKNGSSQEQYCPKFNRPFREGVRAIWDYHCGGCGKLQSDNIILKNGIKQVAKLSVHHVHYLKDACCSGESEGWMFAPLCHECHGKSNGSREEWQNRLVDIITNKMNRKSYLTETEYKMFFAQKKLNPALTVSDFLQK